MLCYRAIDSFEIFQGPVLRGNALQVICQSLNFFGSKPQEQPLITAQLEKLSQFHTYLFVSNSSTLFLPYITCILFFVVLQFSWCLHILTQGFPLYHILDRAFWLLDRDPFGIHSFLKPWWYLGNPVTPVQIMWEGSVALKLPVGWFPNGWEEDRGCFGLSELLLLLFSAGVPARKWPTCLEHQLWGGAARSCSKER